MRVKVLLASCAIVLALLACPTEGAGALERGDGPAESVIAASAAGVDEGAPLGDILTEGDSLEEGIVEGGASVSATDPEKGVALEGEAEVLVVDEGQGETGVADSDEPESSTGVTDTVLAGDGEESASDGISDEGDSSLEDQVPAPDASAVTGDAAEGPLMPSDDILSLDDPATDFSLTDEEAAEEGVKGVSEQSDAAAETAKQVATVTSYRMYNPNSGEHFYTLSTYERDSLVKAGWRYEGVGWTSVVKSNTPVYRLYNPNAGDHHYTTSAYERDSLIRAGWRYEGVGWYSDDDKGIALYRTYNPNASTGTHHYTTSLYERLNIVSAGWRYEGLAWYAVDLGPFAPSDADPGWVESGGRRFYVGENGQAVTGWQTIGGTRYHFDGRGRLSTGLSDIDGTVYYLKSDGTPDAGWKDMAGYRYYFNSDGSMYRSGWLTLSGKTYYLDKTSGAMATGDKWIDGVLRPFASNGVCLKTGYQVSWKGLHLAAENVSLPSYANGSSWSYVHPCTISAGATREQCIEAFIAVAYEYMNAGTPWVDNNCGRPGTTVDCSGLVMEGLYAAGMDLTGVAGGDFNPYSKYYWNHSFANTWRENQTFQPVSRSELERGDLVYWNGHVAIYLGNGQIIESTSVASNVHVRSLYAENLILGYARPFTK